MTVDLDRDYLLKARTELARDLAKACLKRAAEDDGVKASGREEVASPKEARRARAARVQREALAAGRLSRDIVRQELLNLGDVANPTPIEAVAALAAEEAWPGNDGQPADAERLGRDLARSRLAHAATHPIVASITAQTQRRRDWCSALGQELEDRRVIAHQLITEGLRLIASDERRQTIDRAMQWLDEIERRELPAG
jgi:hypothetical protein